MKRFVVRTVWLSLILAAATAFGQAVPSTTSPAQPASSATPQPLSASLLLLKADWSKVPAAKEIESELRAALKEATVPKELLDKLPASGPQILFSPESAAIYKPEHYRELIAWLKAKDLLIDQTPFADEKGSINLVSAGNTGGIRMHEFTAKLAKPYDFLKLPPIPAAAAQPFVARTVEFQWHAGDTGDRGSSFWVERRLVVLQETRGREKSEPARPVDTCIFRWRQHLPEQVVVFDTFPDGVDSELAAAARRQGFVALVAVWPADQPAAGDVAAKLHLPDTVQVDIAKKGATHHWTQTWPLGVAPAVASPAPIVPPQSNQGKTEASANPLAAAPASPSPATPEPFAAPAGSPATASGPFAAPPVDAKGKPVGSAARQVTDGKIIIAWSEGKDVAWGFSTSVGKWARQEINPPANGSSWPIVGGGSSAWQVGSAYYGFSGKVAQWDVVRLPDGHEPKPTVFQDFVVVNDGTSFYAFSGKTARWDVLRLPDNHKPTISFDANYVRVSDGDDVYVFADATGRWSSTKDAAGGAASNPNSADVWQIKVFTLQNARAADLAKIVLQIVGKEVESVVADERTNTIVARGPPETLEVIRALLDRLDIQPDPKTKPAEVEIGGVSGTIKLDTTASAAELTKQYAAKEQQAAEIAAQLRELQAENSSNKAQVQKLTADLRRAVSEAFAARQQLHQVELAELTQRMQQIEQTVQLRSRISEQIIDRRVQDLLNLDLQWDQLADSGPRLPSKVTPAPATDSSSTSSSRPRVLVGAAFGAWADEICDVLGLTVHRLKKEELQDQKLLGCLKITAISEGSPANEFQVGDIITMMQTGGVARVGMRRVTMSLLRGTERIPVTVEFPSPQQSDTPASTPRPRVMYGAAFGADADKVWNSIGIKVHLLTFDETAPDHKYLGCPKITFIDPDGPAHELQVGDLIVTLQVGSTGRDFAYATLDILRGMETFRVVVEYPSPPPTKGQSASSPTKGQSASPLRRLREPKVSVGFGSEAFRICESLGLTVQNLKKDEISDPKLISALKISAISSDSPASELKVGDIITMMQTSGTLSGARRLTMNIRRGAETFPVTVEFPAAPAAAAENDANLSPSQPSPASTDATDTDQSANMKYGARFGNQETKIWNTLGVKVVAVAKEDLPISGYQGGAKITEVRPGSPAAGLHVGDIIVGLLNWEVTSPERLLWTLSQPISNQSGRGEFFGKHWSVETAIIYFLRDKNARQATLEFPLQPPAASDPSSTPADAGRAALPPATSGTTNLALPPSTGGQPLMLRSADAFRRTIQEFDELVEVCKTNIAKLQQDLSDGARLEKEDLEKARHDLKSYEQGLAKNQQELKFVRDEFATQIRLLELALQDSQAKAESALKNKRRIEQVVAQGAVPQAEAEAARQAASSAQHQADQLTTLLDLYRKADPAKPAPATTADDKSPQPTAKPKQGEGQPR